jgi:ATP-dependent Lhr-like helicase
LLAAATADSFTGLRAPLTPSNRKTQARAKARGYDITNAGRWSRWRDSGRAESRSSFDRELVEKIARILLRRYGVVFKRLLEREGLPAPRELLRVFHRLEARGDQRRAIRRGLQGEQFALPEAVSMLRSIRRNPADNVLVSISAADPPT